MPVVPGYEILPLLFCPYLKYSKPVRVGIGARIQAMAGIEAFKEKYQLSPVEADLVERVLFDEKEEVIDIGFSARQRLKDEAKGVGMEFLAAAIIRGEIIRVYFRYGNQATFRDIPFTGGSPDLGIFRNAASFKEIHRIGLGSARIN